MDDQCIPTGLSSYDRHRIGKGIFQVLSATGSDRASGRRPAPSSLLSIPLCLLRLRPALLWLPGVGAWLLGEGMDQLRLAADLAPGPLEVPLGSPGPEGSVRALEVRMANQMGTLFIASMSDGPHAVRNVMSISSGHPWILPRGQFWPRK